MLTIINLTPHIVKLNSGIEFPPSGTVARVSAQWKRISSIIYTVEYGEIEGLPEPEEGKLYIVSAMVLEAGKRIGRNDLMAPASGHPETIRNEQGQIVSVPGFVI